MRYGIRIILLASCWLISEAAAQTIFKNSTNEWILAINVQGSDGKAEGSIYCAPHSELFLESGKVDHGAGKFVAAPSSRMVIGCPSTDNEIDFIAIEVEEIDWDAFGRPQKVILKRPIANYHIRGRSKDDLLVASLQKHADGSVIAIEPESDAVLVSELAGQIAAQQNLTMSLSLPSARGLVTRPIGLHVNFFGCSWAGAVTQKGATGDRTSIRTGATRERYFLIGFSALLVAGLCAIAFRLLVAAKRKAQKKSPPPL